MERLNKIICRWFLAASLTGRYTGSPESTVDSDLKKISEVKNEDCFVDFL